MTLDILKHTMSEGILRVATLELREWEHINRSLVEMGFDWSGIECAGHIKRCLKEIKESFSLFNDPEFSLVQYKPFIEKLNNEIHENYNQLLSHDFEDDEKKILKENKPSNYENLVLKTKDDYVEIRDVFKGGKTISDFQKIEGFDPDLTQREIREVKSKTPRMELFTTVCVRRVFVNNTETFLKYEPNFLGNYPDFKERVCSAVYDRFLSNPELLKLER